MKVKPHIWHHGAYWYCNGVPSFSPVTAYWNWGKKWN